MRPVFKSRDVFQWPEFQALARRLGIRECAYRRSLSIALECNGPVEVTETYFVEQPVKDEVPKDEPGARSSAIGI